MLEITLGSERGAQVHCTPGTWSSALKMQQQMHCRRVGRGTDEGAGEVGEVRGQVREQVRGQVGGQVRGQVGSK